jgi:ankyrin repeat protein
VLLHAAMQNHADAIAALLQHGCATAEQRYKLAAPADSFALMYAARDDCASALVGLLQHGCATHCAAAVKGAATADSDGRTAQMRAAM